MSSIITLRVNGTEYKIDCALDGFSAGELNGIERNTGMPWGEWLAMLGNKKVSSLAWTALAWLAVRRSGNPIPWDEFEDSIKVMELLESVDNDEAQEVVRTARRGRKS